MKKIGIIMSFMIFILGFNISFAQDTRDEKIKTSIKNFLQVANLAYEEEKYDINISYENEVDYSAFIEITLKNDDEEYVYDFEIKDDEGNIYIDTFENYLEIENGEKIKFNKENFSKYKKLTDKIVLDFFNTYQKNEKFFDVNNFSYKISEYNDEFNIYYYPSKNGIIVDDVYIKLAIDNYLNLMSFYYDDDIYGIDLIKSDELKKLSKNEVIKKSLDTIDLREGYLCSGNKKFNKLVLKPCYFDIDNLNRYVDLKEDKVYTKEFRDFNIVLDSMKIELNESIKEKLKSKSISDDKIVDEKEAKIIALNIAKKYLSKGCYIKNVDYYDDVYEMEIEDKSQTGYNLYIDIDEHGSIEYFDISYSAIDYLDKNDVDYEKIYINALNLLSELKPDLKHINLNAIIKKSNNPKVIFFENIEGKDILNSYIEFSYCGNYLISVEDYLELKNIKDVKIEILDYKISKKDAMNMIKDSVENNYKHNIFYSVENDKIYYKLEFNDDVIDANKSQFINKKDYN